MTPYCHLPEKKIPAIFGVIVAAHMVRPCSKNGRRKIAQNSIESGCQNKREHEEDRRKTGWKEKRRPGTKET